MQEPSKSHVSRGPQIVQDRISRLWARSLLLLKRHILVNAAQSTVEFIQEPFFVWATHVNRNGQFCLCVPPIGIGLIFQGVAELSMVTVVLALGITGHKRPKDRNRAFHLHFICPPVFLPYRPCHRKDGHLDSRRGSSNDAIEFLLRDSRHLQALVQDAADEAQSEGVALRLCF